MEVSWVLQGESLEEGRERIETLQYLSFPGMLPIKGVQVNAFTRKITVQRQVLGTDLPSYLHTNGAFTEEEVASMLLQVATVLSEAESYVNSTQNFYPGGIYPDSIFVHDGRYYLDVFDPTSQGDQYWQRLKDLAVLAVYAGLGKPAAAQEAGEDIGRHLARLPWRPEFGTLLLDLFYSKRYPRFIDVVSAVRDYMKLFISA